MEQLLGPNLLVSPDAAISTHDSLNESNLVLLYFSASWCPPCRAFSPILKQFYNSYCTKYGNGVEIIFVSSDKTVQSFAEYFSTMPWLALPKTAQGAQYAQTLSSKLCINSIPTLVVLDSKTGNYITNNAKAQVASVAHDLDKSMDLIQSWKSQIEKAVPIEEANLGVVSSIFSTFKKGMNYVTGTNKDVTKPDDNTEGTVSAPPQTIQENSLNDAIASTIMSFFEGATHRLKEYPKAIHQKNLIQKLNQDDNEEDAYMIPVPLEEHRQRLLHQQLDALEEAVDASNQTLNNTATITGDDIQICLRSLGVKDFTNITNDEQTQQQLLDAMSEMNEVARMAFARSVLWSEYCWLKQEQRLQKEEGQDQHISNINYQTTNRKLRGSDDDIPLDRSGMLEFCGLCSTAVKLPEVEAHLGQGIDIFDDGIHDDDDDLSARYQTTSPEHRILQLQHMMLCAVGLEPSFGGMELRRIMLIQGEEGNEGDTDDELDGAIATYLLSLQAAGKKAMQSALDKGLSDESEGGVTKVVSVTYSEKKLNSCGGFENANGVPTNVRMEQQEHETDQEKMAQLRMAAKAASLQQSILDELTALGEEERKVVLANAKEIHESFVAKAMAIQSAPERVAFLQSVTAENQRQLLMYKLWESNNSSM